MVRLRRLLLDEPSPQGTNSAKIRDAKYVRDSDRGLLMNSSNSLPSSAVTITSPSMMARDKMIFLMMNLRSVT